MKRRNIKVKIVYVFVNLCYCMYQGMLTLVRTYARARHDNWHKSDPLGRPSNLNQRSKQFVERLQIPESLSTTRTLLSKKVKDDRKEIDIKFSLYYNNTWFIVQMFCNINHPVTLGFMIITLHTGMYVYACIRHKTCLNYFSKIIYILTPPGYKANITLPRFSEYHK